MAAAACLASKGTYAPLPSPNSPPQGVYRVDWFCGDRPFPALKGSEGWDAQLSHLSVMVCDGEAAELAHVAFRASSEDGDPPASRRQVDFACATLAWRVHAWQEAQPR